MGITKKDVEYVAELARLKFGEDKIDRFTYDLNSIIEYINKLNELDTEGFEASVNPLYIENAFREDEVKESLSKEDVLLNAPDKQSGYFKVPKIIEG